MGGVKVLLLLVCACALAGLAAPVQGRCTMQTDRQTRLGTAGTACNAVRPCFDAHPSACAAAVLLCAARVFSVAAAGSLSLRQLDDSLSLLEADGQSAQRPTDRQTAERPHGDFGLSATDVAARRPDERDPMATARTRSAAARVWRQGEAHRPSSRLSPTQAGRLCSLLAFRRPHSDCTRTRAEWERIAPNGNTNGSVRALAGTVSHSRRAASIRLSTSTGSAVLRVDALLLFSSGWNSPFDTPLLADDDDGCRLSSGFIARDGC